MAHVQDITLKELNKRRKAILGSIGMSYEELAAKAADHRVVARATRHRLAACMRGRQ